MHVCCCPYFLSECASDVDMRCSVLFCSHLHPAPDWLKDSLSISYSLCIIFHTTPHGCFITICTTPEDPPCHVGIVKCHPSILASRHIYSKHISHHPCMAECAVTQTQRRNTPLKFCFLLSHTHLTKAVKSMVGMVSVS